MVLRQELGWLAMCEFSHAFIYAAVVAVLFLFGLAVGAYLRK